MSSSNKRSTSLEDMGNPFRPIVNRNESDIYRKTFGALICLGVPMNLRGFDYLASAITLAVCDPSFLHGVTKRLYPAVAKTYGTNQSCVERNIRTAIESTFLNRDLDILHDYFGTMINSESGKVKNSVFISKIAANVRLEMLTENDSKTEAQSCSRKPPAV